MANSRIVYVEPNYVNGLSKNGIDFSVPLDDLCISVDLIAEVVSRNSVTTSTDVIVSNAEINKISFFEGIKLDNEKDDSFLTTYFTNITYEDTNGKSIVEGLGISSINISFDSWYMPIVSIKFVDVRGSSIFTPNEYDNNNSKKTYVTSDKIYKCFFTFPYPKFKLVVKGFYGKPVTFQLTCSKFNGRFNSENGNFEATANFIGYNYSLLTDINIQYLVSAPQDNFYGKNYFDSKKNSNEWLLSGGEEMPRLKDLIASLKTAGSKIDEILNTDKTSLKNRQSNREIELLDNISDLYRRMISLFNQFSSLTVVCQNENEIVFGINFGSSKEPYTTYTSSFVTAQSNFISSIKTYNSEFSSNAFKKIPNDYDLDKKINTSDRMEFSLAFKIETDDGKIKSVVPLEKDGTSMSGKSARSIISGRVYNNNRKLSENTISQLLIMMKEKNPLLRSHIYIFSKNNIENEIKKRREECQRVLKNNIREVSQLIDKTIKSTIGFIPSVGNMSKIIFAHMETFLHSIFRCMNNISSELLSGNRSFDKFGVSVSQTDLNCNSDSGNNVLAFPMIANASSDNDLQIYKWIGDLVPDAQEVQLVNGYIEATAQTIKENQELSNEINNGYKIEDFCQINPCDFSYSKSPFSYVNIDGNHLIDLITHIGTRSTYLFGIMSDSDSFDERKLINISKIAGKLDACNYYLRGISKEIIKSEIIEKIGTGDSSADKVINILKCINNEYADYNESTKKYRYYFELVNGTDYNKERNPIIVDSDSSYLYSYIYTEYGGKKNMLVPVYPHSIKDYMRVYTEDGTPFRFPNLFDENYNNICATISDDFLNSDTSISLDESSYVNVSIFNIFNDNEVKNIYNKYETYRNGTINVRDYNTTISSSEINDMLNNLWHLKDSDLKKYYDNAYSNDLNEYIIYFLKKDLVNEDLNKLLPSNIDDASKLTDMNVWQTISVKYNGITKGTEGQVVLNTFKELDDNIDSYSIPYIDLLNSSSFEQSLFGTDFYYMQNLMKDYETNEKDSIERSMKSKALMFLSCIPMYRTSDFISDNKIGGIYFASKLTLLYIGGLLWRERYFIEHNDDCFIYTDGSLTLKKPYECVNGNVNEQYKYTLLGNSINKIKINKWGKEADSKIFKLRKSVKNLLIQFFEEWCDNSIDGFSYIKNQCELFDDENGKCYNRKDIEKIAVAWNNSNTFRGGKNSEILGSSSEENIQLKKEFLSRFGNNFLKNYSLFKVCGTSNFRFTLRNNTELSYVLKKLYSDVNIVCVGCYNIFDNDKEIININKSALKSYISSFIKMLNDIANSKSELPQNEYEDISFNKDVKIAMYNYFKSIHDKWLIGCNEKQFDVENFLTKNFLFVDTFYRDIKDKLIINCDYFASHILDIPEDYTLFSFLADLYSHHGMIFTPMSHYNNWAEEDTLSNMFKPYSYNSVTTIDDENKFICMYVHEPSRNLNIGGNGSAYGFSDDSFQISDISMQPSVFLRSNYNSDGSIYGYPIPAFGVSFGKSNQAYFKNINVSMDNPVTTEYSIKAIGEIANLGKNGNTSVQFIGQDIYSVYANYSYYCEVEMMGCAQIQPLMYFQLTNIPMFRGTYIITKVTHEIIPGKMITKFVGFRMSKFGHPFNTLPFANLNILFKNYSNSQTIYNLENSNENEYSDVSYDGEYVYVNPDSISESELETCGCGNGGNGFDGLTTHMKKLFYAIKQSVEKYQENSNEEKWTICVYSGMDKARNSASDHFNGNAMDLQIIKNDTIVGKGQDKKELGIVFEIICKYYFKYIKQLILEYYNPENSQTNENVIKTIHISSIEGYDRPPQIIQTYGSNDINVATLIEDVKWTNQTVGYYSSTSVVNYGFSIVDKIMTNLNNSKNLIKEKDTDSKNKAISEQTLIIISKYYKNAASMYIEDYYPNRMVEFKRIFTSFSGVSDTTLSYYFDLNNSKLLLEYLLTLNKSYDGYKNQKRCDSVYEFKSKLNNICSTYGLNSNWLMGVMAAESGIDPSAFNKNSSTKATGLIQFIESTYRSYGIQSHEELQEMDATKQLDYVEMYLNDNAPSRFNKPVDVYLMIFAPTFLKNNINNLKSNTIICSKGEASYESNSNIDKGGKGYITVHDMEIWLFDGIKKYAKEDDYEILNKMMENIY